MKKPLPVIRRGRELPLRETARRFRRNLVLLSVFTCLLASGLLASNATTALGLEFDATAPGALDYLALGLLAYWAIGFMFHSAFDLTTWGSRGGRPRGFFGGMLMPLGFSFEFLLPLGLAGLAALALQPKDSLALTEDVAQHVQDALQGIREDGIADRVAENREHALRRADLALTADDAEEILMDAILDARTQARSLSDPELLADCDGELEAKLHQIRFDSILERAELFRFQGDLPAAAATFGEALFFLTHDDIDDAEQTALIEEMTTCARALEPRPAEMETNEDATAAAEQEAVALTTETPAH